MKNRKIGGNKNQESQKENDDVEEKVEKRLSILQLKNLIENENNKYVAKKLIYTTILMISIPILVYFFFPLLISGNKNLSKSF